MATPVSRRIVQRSKGPTAETTLVRRWSTSQATLDVTFAIKQPLVHLGERRVAPVCALLTRAANARSAGDQDALEEIADAIDDHEAECRLLVPHLRDGGTLRGWWGAWVHHRSRCENARLALDRSRS